MPPQQREIPCYSVRLGQKSLLRRVLREPFTLPAKQKGVALLSGLTLATAVAVPTLWVQHGRPADVIPGVVSVGQGAQSGTAYVPGSLSGQTGPADWALVEGGLYGSSVLPSADVVQEWGWAEGRYFWDPVSSSPAGKRHGH